MCLVIIDITKSYLNDKISLEKAIGSHADKENNPKFQRISRNEFFSQSFLLLKESKSLSDEERIAYLEKLSIKLKKIKANRELSSISSQLQNYLFNKSIDFEKLNNKLEQIRTTRPGMPKIYEQKFNNLFTHLILDSVCEKQKFRSSGFNNIKGLLTVRDLLQSYMQNPSFNCTSVEGNVLSNLYLALRNAINFRLVSNDFTNSGKEFENHKRLLNLMLEKTLETITSDTSTVRPFTLFSMKSKRHSIMLKVSYDRSKNNFSAEVINTGYGCLKVDENYLHTTDSTFKGVKKASLFNLISIMLNKYEKFEDLLSDGRKALFSEGVQIEDGRYHCTQRGGSCVLKSIMSAVHGSFPNEILYRDFKVFLTKHLIKKASRKRRFNTVSTEKLSFAKETILKKRLLKLDLANAEAERKNLSSSTEKCENSHKRIDEINRAIKELEGRE